MDFPHYFTRTDPPAGTVVREGSELKIFVGGG